MTKNILASTVVFSAIAASHVAEAAVITLDPEVVWGVSETEIDVTDPSVSSSSDRGSFIATNVAGSGIDVRFTIIGDSLREGFPQTRNHGDGVGIQGSVEASAAPTISSFIDTDTNGANTYATRGYVIEFFETGTTNAQAISNLTVTIGDVDEDERYGFFEASAGITPTSFSIENAPGHVTEVNNGEDPLFIMSNATSVTNTTTDGDVDINVAGNVDTFTFTGEKGRNANLGVVIGLISFDPGVVSVPEPSSSLLLGVSCAGFLLRRKRNSNSAR